MVTVSRHRLGTGTPRRGAVVPFVEGNDLKALYDRYRAVSGRLAPDLIETPEMAEARAALIHALLDDGWIAPDIVHERLRSDERVLHPQLEVA